MILFNANKTSGYTVKRIQVNGEDRLVVPVVMMVEGVHPGSQGPLLHTKEELAKNTAAWNGMPVVVNHPQDAKGTYISANSEPVLQEYGVGDIANARFEDEKLKADLCIDPVRLDAISSTALQAITSGEVLEVSIGSFVEQIKQEGLWEDIPYKAIATNIQPDHLAILPSETGACSVEKGCGLGVNVKKRKESANMIDEELNVFSVIEGDIKKGLEATARQTISKTLLKEGLVINELTVDVKESMNERLDRLYDSVYAMETETVYYSLVAAFDDHVIYRKRDSSTKTVTFWKQMYRIADDETVEWVDAPIQVVQEIVYKPVDGSLTNNNDSVEFKRKPKKEVQMLKKNECPVCVNKVNDLIANKDTAWTEEDRMTLEVMSEEQLDRLTPVKAPKADPVVNRTITKEEAYAALDIKNPAEFQAQVRYGLQVYQSERTRLASVITANTKEGTWTDEELAAMDFEVLRKLATSVQKEDGSHEMDFSLNMQNPVERKTGKPEIAPMLMPGVELESDTN